jgi:MFS family permease
MKSNQYFPLTTIAALTIALATVSSLAAGPMPSLVVTTSGSGSGWAWISAIVGILAGGGLIVGSVASARKAKESLQWPSVPGTVLSSRLVPDTSGDIASFTPVVTYAYVVNGQALQCDRVHYSSTTSKKVLTKYPQGSTVQVFFDPRAPSTAVLEQGGSTRTMLFVGIAVAVGGCVIGSMMR